MKKTTLNQCLLPLLAAIALVASTSQTRAQFPQGDYVNNFAAGGNTTPFAGSGSVASWIYWYSAPGGGLQVTNDVTTPDPLGGPGAGSLLINTPFGTGGNQNLFFGTFGNQYGYDFSVKANLLDFDTVSFDIYVNPTNQVTGPNTDGNWGQLEVGVIDSGYAYRGFGAPGRVTIPGVASNGWVHFSVPIDKTIAGITTIPGICFNYNSYSTGFPKTNFNFWLGNLVVHYTGLPPAPPTVGLQKITAPGLTQFADKTPSYNRQNIATGTNVGANLTWYGQPKPVVYSWKIGAYPSGAHPGFTSGLSLTPDAAASQNYADPDWTATNNLWIAMQNNPDGTVTAGIAFKTNQPSGNSQYYSAPGQLVPSNNTTNGLTVPSAVGTWTVTFTSDTALTLTAPNGSSTNVTLPSDFAALYNGYVGAFLYSSPANDANIGQYCTYSAFNITGVVTPINENLASGAISSPYLSLISQNYNYTGNYVTNPPNQVFATAADAYWFSWTLPAAGFSPVSSPSLSSPVWNDLAGAPFLNGGGQWVKVPKSALPSSGAGFYAMVQRKFTKLQVLLPGQTNAPGTALGYVGTPTPQSVTGSGTDITVNAVDATFHIVGGVTDQIGLATSDTGAFLPAPVYMVNGTATFTGSNNLLWGNTGTFTVTATDTTTVTIPAATSASVVVGP